MQNVSIDLGNSSAGVCPWPFPAISEPAYAASADGTATPTSAPATNFLTRTLAQDFSANLQYRGPVEPRFSALVFAWIAAELRNAPDLPSRPIDLLRECDVPFLGWAADLCTAEGLTDEEASNAITNRWQSAREKIPAIVDVARQSGHFPAYANLERLEAVERDRLEREAVQIAARKALEEEAAKEHAYIPGPDAFVAIVGPVDAREMGVTKEGFFLASGDRTHAYSFPPTKRLPDGRGLWLFDNPFALELHGRTLPGRGFETLPVDATVMLTRAEETQKRAFDTNAWTVFRPLLAVDDSPIDLATLSEGRAEEFRDLLSRHRVGTFTDLILANIASRLLRLEPEIALAEYERASRAEWHRKHNPPLGRFDRPRQGPTPEFPRESLAPFEAMLVAALKGGSAALHSPGEIVEQTTPAGWFAKLRDFVAGRDEIETKDVVELLAPDGMLDARPSDHAEVNRVLRALGFAKKRAVRDGERKRFFARTE